MALRRSAIALGTAAIAAAPAAASIPLPVRIVCPTDGRVIDTYQDAAFSSWGERPDGKPYGSAEFPVPLVECADGMVMYRRQFEPQQVDRLRPILASPDYAALGRAGHPSYYRAYWLMRQMGEPARDQLAMLVQAIWQAEASPALRRRYLAELVERSGEIGGHDDLVGLALRARAINALRELGRFEQASAMLRATSFDAAAVGSDAAEVRAWRRYYRRLAAIVARADGSIEPADMIPRREARRRRRGAAADD